MTSTSRILFSALFLVTFFLSIPAQAQQLCWFTTGSHSKNPQYFQKWGDTPSNLNVTLLVSSPTATQSDGKYLTFIQDKKQIVYDLPSQKVTAVFYDQDSQVRQRGMIWGSDLVWVQKSKSQVGYGSLTAGVSQFSTASLGIVGLYPILVNGRMVTSQGSFQSGKITVLPSLQSQPQTYSVQGVSSQFGALTSASGNDFYATDVDSIYKLTLNGSGISKGASLKINDFATHVVFKHNIIVHLSGRKWRIIKPDLSGLIGQEQTILGMEQPGISIDKILLPVRDKLYCFDHTGKACSTPTITTSGANFHSVIRAPCPGQTPQTCTPGNTRPCYTGPQNTENVGTCKGGTQTCNSAGTAWGLCQGETTPATETCNGNDDDCDGVIDNGSQLSNCCNGQPCQQEPSPEPTPDAGPEEPTPEPSSDGGPGDIAPDASEPFSPDTTEPLVDAGPEQGPPDAGESSPEPTPDGGPDTSEPSSPDTTEPAPDVSEPNNPDTSETIPEVSPFPKSITCKIGSGRILSGDGKMECDKAGHLLTTVSNGIIELSDDGGNFATLKVTGKLLLSEEVGGGTLFVEGKPQYLHHQKSNGSHKVYIHNGVLTGTLGTNFVTIEDNGWYNVDLRGGAVWLGFRLNGRMIRLHTIAEFGLSQRYHIDDLRRQAQRQIEIEKPPVGCSCSISSPNETPRVPISLLALCIFVYLRRRYKK